MKGKTFATLGLFALLLFEIGCSVKPIYFKEDEKLAKEGIAKFQQYFNDSNFDSLYELTSPIAKQEKSKDAFYEAMKILRSKYGKIQSMDVITSKVQAVSGSSRSATIAYKMGFENKIENLYFIWLISSKNESGLYEFGILDEENLKKLKSQNEK